MSKLAHYFLPRTTNNHRAKLLHPTSISLIIILFCLFQIGLGRFSQHFPNILGYASNIPPAEIINQTNKQRESHGLSALKLNTELSAAAAQKAADMFARDYWAHVSPLGTQPWYFITQSGYNYRYAGENLARDFTDPVSVVQAWMNSPTHRDNLLNNRYQDIGVAVVDGKLGGRETTLVVQMFGTPLEAQTNPEVSSAFTVQAKEAVLAPAPQAATPKISPFATTQYVSIGILSILGIALILDVYIISRKKIVRWTSKGLAHLIFITVLLVAITLVMRGRIV